MTTNERGHDELDFLHEGWKVREAELLCEIESTRTQSLAEGHRKGMELLRAAQMVCDNAPLVGAGTTEITTHHESGGLATMGPVMTGKFIYGLKALEIAASNFRAALSEHAAKEKGRNCTCLGSCKGKEGLAPGWICAMEKSPSGSDGKAGGA